MKAYSIEKFVEQTGLDGIVYPVTIMKFILNRGKYVRTISRLSNQGFGNMFKFKVNDPKCPSCIIKKDNSENKSILCRQHTSIERVLTAEKVLVDEDTGYHFYKNEIFFPVGNNLVLFYCPHFKLLKPGFNSFDVLKSTLIVASDDNMDPQFANKIPIKQLFKSSEWINRRNSCWFNDEFTIINQYEGGVGSNFVLALNK